MTYKLGDTFVTFDPSLTSTGYAVATDHTQSGLKACGQITTQSGYPLASRLDELMLHVQQVLTEAKPVQAVIETPALKTHGRIPGRAQGQALYGCAVGVVFAVCSSRLGFAAVECVDPSWTGRESEKARVTRIRREFSRVDWPKSHNGTKDQATAVALGQWWYQRRRMAFMAGVI